MSLPKQFLEGRRIPNVHPKSLESREFWDEQLLRSDRGYSFSGHSLTNDHYFFLNFFKMEVVINRRGDTELTLPYYSKEDEKLFKLLEEARETGKGFLFVTGRGYGKSYIVDNLCARQYTLYPSSHCIISSSYEKPAKDLFEKVGTSLMHVPAQIRHNRLVSNPTLIKAGIKYKDEFGIEKEKGFLSKIERITFENNAGKTRGTRPRVHAFEEIGAWTGAAKLIPCYNESIGSYHRGGYKTCFPVLIGTGGQMLSGGSVDASIMFRNPKSFDLLAITEDELSKPTCYFIPTFKKFGAFYEKEGPVILNNEEVGFVAEAGLSDEAGAKAYLERKREEKKDDPKSYNQYIQEYPFTAQEAFMVSGANTFDTRRLYNHLANLQTKKALADRVKRYTIEFVYGAGGKPVGVEAKEDPINGEFLIVEEPMRDANGGRYDNLYISGCDSYDADGGVSLGSIFVKKRFLHAQTTGNCYVAQYTGRPDSANDFYEATLKLNLWYNAHMMVEHTKIAIINYYRNLGVRYFDMLMDRPSVCYADITKSRATNEKGIQMPEQIRTYGIKAINTYLKTYCEEILFPDLVNDLIGFDPEESTKFDRVMAMLCLEIADAELVDLMAKAQNQKTQKVKKRVCRTVNGVKRWMDVAA